MEWLLDEAIAASRRAMESAGCVVEKRADANLPAVLGDAMALRQALANLLANAAKYGAGASRWIGLSASLAADGGVPAIEIRVADRRRRHPGGGTSAYFRPFSSAGRAPSVTRYTEPDWG